MTFIAFNKTRIESLLHEQQCSIPYKLHLFQEIDSTNCYLKQLAPSTVLDICCAEMQTQGRGRFGRQWHSPFGQNIYCSMRFASSIALSELSGLSLVCSLAVLATIHAMCPSEAIKIKWPNDLLWHDKKLCGSLIELVQEPNHRAQIIIGIGLNVNANPAESTSCIEQPWSSLYELSQKEHDRNVILVHLITQVQQYISRFMTHGLTLFLDEWKLHDYLAGQYITINQPTGSVSGIAQGISTQGQLILRTQEGVTHYCSFGETSLKKMGVCPG